jgi:hypothetical protein
MVCEKRLPSFMVDFDITEFMNMLWFTEQMLLCHNESHLKPMNVGQLFCGSLC